MHAIQESFCGAVCSHDLEGVGDRAHGQSQRRDGEDDAVVAQFGETGDREQGGLAELGHVGEEEDVGVLAHGGCIGCEVLLAVEALGEEHVGAGVDVGLATGDRTFKAFNTRCIGPGADDKGAAGLLVARLGGDGDLFLEVVDGDEGLAVEVATALGEDLVLKVASRGAGSAVFPDDARDHFALAEAGVGVGDEGEPGAVCDVADEAAEVVDVAESDIGDA